MVTRLMLSDGGFVYPNFLSVDEKAALRERIIAGKVAMRCSCRSDIELAYGVSVDNRIIPLHKWYEHAAWCSRNQGDKRTAASTYDEEGNTTVFLGFNPKNFTLPKIAEREEVDVSPDNEKDDTTSEVPAERHTKKKDRLPTFSLRQMVRSINRDTYSERLMAGKNALLSEEYFRSALLSHLKKVYVSGMERSLRDLSLDEDHLSFFYGKVEQIEETTLHIGGMNRTYRRFVLDKVYRKAQDEFAQLYGEFPEDCLGKMSVYAAGFAYKRVSRLGKAYTCVGRLCLFLVSRNGLYVDSVEEKDILDAVLYHTTRCGGVFLFPDSDEAPYYGIFRIPRQNKEGYVYLKESKDIPRDEAAICFNEVPDRERLEQFVNNICFGK